MTTKFSIGRQKGDGAVTKATVTRASVSGVHAVGGRLLGPSAMGPACDRGLGRRGDRDWATGDRQRGDPQIARGGDRNRLAKVGTLEVGGRLWPEAASASEPPETPESPATP